MDRHSQPLPPLTHDVVPTDRLDFVDNMKAIGIIFVVFGHAPGLGTVIGQTIYGFHMPLFFFISGFLLKPERLRQPFGTYVATLWRAILVPYLFFFAVSYLYWLPTHEAGSKASKYSMFAWYDPLYSLVVGYGHTNVVLWFFVCLAMTSLGYYLLRRRLSERAVLYLVVVAAVMFVLSHKPSWPRWPWCLDVAVVALLFYAVGRWAKDATRRFRHASPLRLAVVALIALGITFVCTAKNGRVDLYALYFGAHPAFFVPGALAGILFVLSVSLLFRSGVVTRWLSTNTIFIFPTHGLMFSLFTGVGVVVFGLPHDFKHSSAWFGIAYACAALLLSYPAAAAIYRLFPFVFRTRALYKQANKSLVSCPGGQSITTTKSGVP